MQNLWKNTPPPLAGKIRYNAPLSPISWIKAGGSARYMFLPKSLNDIQVFLREISTEVPVYPIGACSNFLLRDGGFDGVIIRTPNGLHSVKVTSPLITADAGVLLPTLASHSVEQGLSGLEFFAGIPGSVGGAVRMNAGAHGQCTADVLVQAQVLHRDGTLHTYTKADLLFQYRSCSLPSDSIVISATFKLAPSTPEICKLRLQEALDYRNETQPKNVATCGSTFKNPPNTQAWSLVKQVVAEENQGPIHFSDIHYNFLVNKGKASATEIENLIRKTQQKIFNKFNVHLEKEIVIIGQHPHAQKDC